MTSPDRIFRCGAGRWQQVSRSGRGDRPAEAFSDVGRSRCVAHGSIQYLLINKGSSNIFMVNVAELENFRQDYRMDRILSG